MKFIRKGGKIIPIKDEKKDKSYHLEMAGAGAAKSVANKIAGTSAIHKMANIPAKNPKMAAMASLIGLGAFGASMVDSYKHGKERDSLSHGIGRAASNLLAFTGGGIAASIAFKNVKKLSGVKKTRKPFDGKTFETEFKKIN